MNKKILIVDDDPGDVILIKRILEPHYQVIEADDGLQATGPVDKECPDLILTDVMIPKESGYRLCAHIKNNSETKHIPIVILTALDTKMNEEIGKEMGADGYLAKPIQANQLLDMVSKLLTENSDENDSIDMSIKKTLEYYENCKTNK